MGCLSAAAQNRKGTTLQYAQIWPVCADLAITGYFRHYIRGCSGDECERCRLLWCQPRVGRSDMDTSYTGSTERRHTAEIFRDNWLWLVLLGVVLIIAG